MPAPRPTAVIGVILAGGHADRLAPLSSPVRPKALLPVAGRPALFYPLLSLARAGVPRAVVVASPESVEVVRSYVEGLHGDKLLAGVEVRVVVGAGDAVGTADVLRELGGAVELGGGEHLLVLTTDVVADCGLAGLVEAHFESEASCSVLLAEMCASAGGVVAGEVREGKGGKAAKKDKKEAAADEYNPELYVTVDRPGRRLLGYVDAADLDDDGLLRVRPALLRRYPDLRVRADLGDVHVYLLAPWVVSRLLPARPLVSSVRLELVPYLVRRQFTLGRKGPEEEWAAMVPGGEGADVRVEVCVVPFGAFVRRVNTPEAFLRVSLEVAGGALERYLGGEDGDGSSQPGGAAGAGKKGGKKGGAGKGAKAESPFATAGERTNVSSDSFIGPNCSAGDRTSVKKSCLGNNVELGAGVKLNGCVLLDNVRVGDGANLAGCVVSSGAVVEKECVLKNCRVAQGVTVPAGTEVDGKVFAGVAEAADTSGFMDVFEFS